MRLTRLSRKCTDLAVLRGLEGDAASLYFAQFNELVLQNKAYFRFTNRNKRPPTDPVNALLSLHILFWLTIVLQHLKEPAWIRILVSCIGIDRDACL